jgi:hypothetical protein
MKDSDPHLALEPSPPDVDENGVDRAQIREMLNLTPAERLLVVQNLAESVAEIRRLNGSAISTAWERWATGSLMRTSSTALPS